MVTALTVHKTSSSVYESYIILIPKANETHKEKSFVEKKTFTMGKTMQTILAGRFGMGRFGALRHPQIHSWKPRKDKSVRPRSTCFKETTSFDSVFLLITTGAGWVT